MTFKTDIKFDESPVLRSLEKVAVDKGLVKPEPITKEASASEIYAPTGDLHEDMLKLVAGLRAKGFEKEAEALEDKINVRKFAETHLYHVIDEEGDELLDFAHPEGDVEVAPSASGLGKVWTEQSAKKEIEKIVRKQPTGKYAARGADVKKIAQEAIDVEAINTKIANYWAAFGAEKPKALSGLGATSDFWNFTLGDILKDEVKRANYCKRSGTSPGAITRYLKLYSAAYGAPGWGGEAVDYSPKDAEDIYKRILASENHWGPMEAATGLKSFRGSKPFTKRRIEVWHDHKPAGDARSMDNTHAIRFWNGSEFRVHLGTARDAANMVQNKVKEAYDAAFGGEKIANATASVKADAQKYAAQVSKAFGDVSTPEHMMVALDEEGEISKSAVRVTKDASLVARRLRPFLKKGAFRKGYEKLVAEYQSGAVQNWEAFDAAIQSAIKSLDGIVSELSPYTHMGALNQAKKNFENAFGAFARYAKTFDTKSGPEYEEVISLKTRSRNFADAVSRAIQSGESTVYEKTEDEILEISQKWLQNTINYTGYEKGEEAPKPKSEPSESFTPEARKFLEKYAPRALELGMTPEVKEFLETWAPETLRPAYTFEAESSLNDDVIIKSAEGGKKGPLAGKPPPPKGSKPGRFDFPGKPGTQPTGKPGGSVTSPLTKSIQQELLKLAELAKKFGFLPEVTTPLEMKPYKDDGMWGNTTVKALQAAQKIRNAHAKQSPAIEAKNSQSTLDNLKALIAALEGAGFGMKQGEVFDEVEGQKVSSMKLVSPYSFYKFLTTDLKQEARIDQETGLEMVNINHFESQIKFLLGRARLKLKEATDNKNRYLASRYIQALRSLWEGWGKTLDYAAKEYTRRAGGEKATGGITYTADTVRSFGQIPVEFLRAGGGAPDFGGPGTGAGSGMRQQRGPGGGIRIELADDAGGRAGEVPEDVVPPITRYINLGDDMWDLDLKVILDYNEFRRMSGPEFATTFFSDEGGDAGADASASDLMEAALKAGYPRNAILYDPKSKQVKIWAVQSGMPWEAGQWVLAKDNPIVTGKLSGGAVSHPNARALNFIRDFRAEISRVYKDWASNILSGNYEKRKEFSSLILGQARRWQKKLSRMENDIKRANMRARRRRR